MIRPAFFVLTTYFTDEPPKTADIFILSKAVSICATFCAVNMMLAAAAFSAKRSGLREPGMGMIYGFLFIIQARDICAGVALFSVASFCNYCAGNIINRNFGVGAVLVI